MTGKAPAMLPSSLLSPLGQTKIYLYAKPLDMRNYAVTVIMPSRPIPTQRKPDSRAAGAVG